MKTDKCVDCGRDLSIWDLDEKLKGHAFSGVINHTCPDCITKRCTENMKNELRRTEERKKMAELEITISNLKEVISAAVSLSIKLEAAQKDLETPTTHDWKHGDVFKSEVGTLMICIRDTSASPQILRVFCVEHAGCDFSHQIGDYTGLTAKFLFNIKEKL